MQTTQQSILSIQAALVGTALEGTAVSERWTRSSPDSVIVVDLPSTCVLEGWEALYSLTGTTKRYPLVGCSIDVEHLLDSPPSDSDLADGDYVKNIISQAREIDGQSELATGGSMQCFSPTVTSDLFGCLDRPIDQYGHVLASTQRRFGSCPSAAEIRALQSSGVLNTDADLERWLLNWELQHFGDQAINPETVNYLKWPGFVEDTQYVAVLPPTPHSWEAFAYMYWYGAEEQAAEKSAALRSFHERYEAHLVCAFSTTLQLKVGRRPANLDEAFDLAIEQAHFASDATSLCGISLREHARALYSLDQWFFLAKP